MSRMVNPKFTEEIAVETAKRLTDWWKHNTVAFVDRGLTLAYVHGGDVVVRETPSKLAKVLRTGAKYSPKTIGSLLDFGSQVITGEDVGGAAIKTGGTSPRLCVRDQCSSISTWSKCSFNFGHSCYFGSWNTKGYGI